MRACPVVALALSGLALLVPSSAVLAQSGGNYALTWSLLSGGGGVSSGPGYVLRGAGEPYGSGASAGGGYLLTAGFWAVNGDFFVGVDDRSGPPTAFRVFPSTPNPFSTSTTIALDLPTDQHVLITVLDVNGQRVRVLLDQAMPAGHHAMTWAGIGDNGRPLAPGVYWIRTQTSSHDHVSKVVVLR